MIGQRPVFNRPGKPADKSAPVLAAKPGIKAREAYRRALAAGKIKPKPRGRVLDIGREFYRP